MDIIQRPGPQSKVGYGFTKTGIKTGIVEHSAEGYEQGMMDVLFGTQYVQSWQASIMKDGRVLQHYPWDTVCYHAGNRPCNISLIGIEHEGRAGEPLTEAQIISSVALANILGNQFNFKLERNVSLFEHNEVVLLYEPNAGPTSCPSGRIPWDRYIQEEEVTQEQFNQMLREAIGLPGGYQDVIEQYLNLLNQRVLALEAYVGNEDEQNQELQDIKSKLAIIKGVL